MQNIAIKLVQAYLQKLNISCDLIAGDISDSDIDLDLLDNYQEVLVHNKDKNIQFNVLFVNSIPFRAIDLSINDYGDFDI